MPGLHIYEKGNRECLYGAAPRGAKSVKDIQIHIYNEPPTFNLS